MRTKTFLNNSELGQAAVAEAATVLRETIARQGKARIIAATGASQISFLKELTALPNIDWQQVEMFHLDEYVGLPMTHEASFRKYLLGRLIKPAGIRRYHLLDGEGDVAAVLYLNDRAAFDRRREAARLLVFGPLPEKAADPKEGDPIM